MTAAPPDFFPLPSNRSTTLAAMDELLPDSHASYSQNGRSLPWRETCYPYASLVSGVMLQQYRFENVEIHCSAATFGLIEPFARRQKLADLVAAGRHLFARRSHGQDERLHTPETRLPRKRSAPC